MAKKTVFAKILVDLPGIGKVGQLGKFFEDHANALADAHAIDPHPDAVAHAKKLDLGLADATKEDGDEPEPKESETKDEKKDDKAKG